MRGRVNALEGREEIGYWREELKPPVEKHTAFQAGNLAVFALFLAVQARASVENHFSGVNQLLCACEGRCAFLPGSVSFLDSDKTCARRANPLAQVLIIVWDVIG